MDWEHQILVNEREITLLPKEYYTPEIEDFYLGYKFEFMPWDWKNKQYLNKWVEGTIKIHTSLHKLRDKYINVDMLRTKCLNEEDIESLGWEYSHVFEGGSKGRFSINFRKSFSGGYYQLEINQNRFVTISLWVSDKEVKTTTSQTHWRGHINSINELITIQKLLNIQNGN